MYIRVHVHILCISVLEKLKLKVIRDQSFASTKSKGTRAHHEDTKDSGMR